MAKVKYNAVVVGGGSVGATKPDKFDSPKTKNVLTLAHAFYLHPQINFIGIVDTDEKKAHDAAVKWNTNYYQSVHQINKQIDIIALCTPTDRHYHFFLDEFTYPARIKPKIILCEKPFGNALAESISMKALLDMNNIPASIDYSRRYVDEFIKLKNELDDGLYGEIYSCVVYYDRGLMRDGSHAIDICNYLFGKYIGGSILSGRRVNDYSDKDLTYPVHMVYEKCGNVFMVPGNGEAFSIFEIDILTERGRFRFIDHGLKMEFYKVEPEKTYGNYNSMSIKPSVINTNLQQALLNYVDNAIKYLDGKANLICTPEDGINVHSIINKLLLG